MNTFLRRPLARLLFSVVCAAWLFALAGCSIVPEPKADPTRYYVLTGPDGVPAAESKTQGALVLGLKRVEMVSYLSGKDMVVREGGNEITYNSYARWAEPLPASISRALTGTLAQSDKVKRVFVQPFPFEVERDYDVFVRVLRCEGERGGEPDASFARFVAEIEVTEAKPGGAIVARKTFVAPEAAWDGEDFGKLATALSGGVRALGEDLVASLPAAK